MVQPSDLTVILQEIRDEQRGTREELHGVREDLQGLARDNAARFEAIEPTLRDLAQQLVVLARGVKVAIDDRRASTERWDDHERRIVDLERKLG